MDEKKKEKEEKCRGWFPGKDLELLFNSLPHAIFTFLGLELAPLLRVVCHGYGLCRC